MSFHLLAIVLGHIFYKIDVGEIINNILIVMLGVCPECRETGVHGLLYVTVFYIPQIDICATRG